MTNFSSKGICDFISRLPDPILHQILWLLKTKKAVQTCALSKTWEHLWTSLPFLDFNFDEYLGDSFQALTESDDDSRVFDESIAVSGRFVKFVNTLLLRCKPLKLDVFNLKCYELSLEYTRHERDWVCYAVNHNTQVLNISLDGSVPCCVYTCTSLEELYINDNRTNLSVQIVNLPNLRDLSICYAELNSNYVKTLLSGCKVLEYLWLGNCTLIDCVISHESLKLLTIQNCRTDKTRLLVNTPNLLSFFYEGELLLLHKATLNMPSITSACFVSCDSLTKTSLEGMATCLRFLTNVEIGVIF